MSQGILTGIITDKNDKETLVGVNVMVGQKGTSSDIDGKYRLELPEGKHEVRFSFIGYTAQSKEVVIRSGESTKLDIQLASATMDIDEFVVVSAGKFEQNLGEVTVSMEVIKPNIIENKNTTSMEDVLQQTPGVSIVDNEPQIRSGSGYSFGAGSRVMILIDDLPILSGDAGRPSWGFLPVENVEQIEVIKGASSVLYGSAALSGVINIRTGYPKAEPQTKVNVFHGVYSDPETERSKYWSGQPMYSGANFFHSRRIGNLDLVVGGNVYYDDGQLGPIIDYEEDASGELTGDSSIASSGYNPFDVNRYAAENRVRLNTNLRYRDQKVQGLSYGINTNWLVGESMNTLLWDNYPNSLYQAFEGSATRTKQVIGTVDPFVEYFTPSGSKHVLRGRWQKLDNNNDNNQDNFSDVYYGEYQVQQHFDSLGIKNFKLTGGLVAIRSEGEADLYNGGAADGNNYSQNYAAYLQADKKFGRLNLSAGIRYEHFEINGDTESKPVFRSGLNYQLAEATFVRASYGQGFRFPTIAEKFIQTSVGLINIYPNVNLQAETSFNAEVGIKQGFKIGNFKGFLDFAYFHQEYENFIEFTFGQWVEEATVDNLFGLGFRSLNTGQSRITGYEISLIGQGKIGEVNIQALCGYTYTRPVSLSPNLVYGETVSQDIVFPENTYLSTSSNNSNNILKYRLQHLVRADIESTWKSWSLGASFRYNSRMQNIDKVFIQLDEPDFFPQVPTGVNQWREENDTGDYVVDLRFSYALSETHKVAIIMNNALNREYAIRPLAIERPRTTSIQYTFSL
jgi:iron complex outermembrane receptor protein